MRRLLHLTVLSMLVLALTASVALGQSRGPSGADGTFNCSDFDDQGQAQQFFVQQGGPQVDLNGLDADRDGQACEGLPTIVDDGTPSGEAVPGEGEDTANAPSNAETEVIERPRNCDEFGGNQVAAQEFLENVTPNDEFNLDADNDGIACEGLLPGGQEGAETGGMTGVDTDTSEAQYADDDMADEGVTNLPDTGGLPLGGVAAGLGAALVAGGLLVRWRLS